MKRGALVIAALFACARASLAQDFAPALPAGPQQGGETLLERALPVHGEVFSLGCDVTRWLARTDFETRSLALRASWRSVSAALGVSQTGDPELGWSAAALAFGAADATGGAALRAALRRDRAAGALASSDLADALGAEAGAGAWLAPAPGMSVWASAPQLWTDGVPPPLARPLELGARIERDGAALWCALAAPAYGGDGERTLGGSIARGGLALWIEARDGPWRGALGVRAAFRNLVAALRLDTHPVLAETTRLSLAWRRAASSAPR